MEGAEQRSMSMWLQTMPKKGFIINFSIFILLFAASIIVGAIWGPPVWTKAEFSAWNCTNSSQTVFDPTTCSGVNLADNTSEFSTVISNVNRLNQQLRLQLTIENIWFDGISTDLNFHIRILARKINYDLTQWDVVTDQVRKRPVTCDKDTLWCDPFYLIQIPFLEYNDYDFHVSVIDPPQSGWMRDIRFTLSFVTAGNTLFELWWRFVFLVCTCVFVVVFAVQLRKFRWAEWSIEQKWTAVLLFALLGYNDPVFPLAILVQGWFPIFLSEVLMATFVALLFFFWLVMFDGIRKETTSITFTKFYLPKIVFIGVCWALVIALLTWARVQQVDNYSYDAVTQLSGYLFLAVILLLVVICYVMWVVFCLFRACVESRGLNYLGTRLRFFGIYTLICMIVVIIGFSVSFLTPYSNSNGARFLTMITMANLYVWVLTVMYLPSKDAKPALWGARTGMKRIGEEGDTSLAEEHHESSETTDSAPATETKPTDSAVVH